MEVSKNFLPKTIKDSCMSTTWKAVKHYINLITDSSVFNLVILTVIFINTFVLTLETYESILTEWENVFSVLEIVFLVIYTFEFLLKIVADPKKYFTNGYDLFDFVILIISYIQVIIESRSSVDDSKLGVLKVLRAFRTLRTMRTISYFKGLQVLVIALIDTLKTWVINIILLMLLIMFLFSMMGFYFFGYNEDGDIENWGTLGRAMLTLFTLVTADGWTDVQSALEEKGYSGSVYFTISCIVFGNFIFTNVFVGVIIMNISDATDEFHRREMEIKRETVMKKKKFMMDRQQNDLKRMFVAQKEGKFSTFKDMVVNFQMLLAHDDSMVITDLCTNLIWMETLIRTLDHMDKSMYRVEQLQFEMANHLSIMMETKLKESVSSHKF